MNTAQKTARFAENDGLTLTQEQIEKLNIYEKLLLEWNKKMNLTAITDSDGIAIKHFYDSLTPLIFSDLPNGAKIIDVGTGAGFPSVPLAIARQDLNFVLLDSLNKRLIFLNEVCNKLNINAELVHMRAEDAAKKLEFREKFNVSISRAVAALPVLCEYCLPFVKKGGTFIAMKGINANQEIEASKNAIKILGAEFEKSIEIVLPDGSTRFLVIIRKTSNTPNQYPRHGSKIAKKSL